MNKSEKLKGLTPSFSFTPKGTLRSKKYKKIPNCKMKLATSGKKFSH